MPGAARAIVSPTPEPVVVVSQPTAQVNQMTKSPPSPQVIYQQHLQTAVLAMTTATTSAPAVAVTEQLPTSS